MRLALLGLLAALSFPAAAQLDRITNGDATSGLRVALEKGRRGRGFGVGKADGFFGND